MATSNTIYLIDTTDGTLTFAIQPRTVDGPGGVQQNTDLTMYGNGAPTWGERFNENFYHLVENFATPAQTPGVPQTKDDLGDLTGTLGINNPILGQTWYNKSTNQLFTYDNSAHWHNVADLTSHGTTAQRATDHLFPVQGQLYYNTETQSIEVYDGGWIDPISAGGFLPTAGGTMTGSLVLDGGSYSGDEAISYDFAEGWYVNTYGGDIMWDGLSMIGNTTPVPPGVPGATFVGFSLGSGETVGPAIIQHMVEDILVPHTNVTGMFQPVYETYTPGNHGGLTGAVSADAKPVFRLSSPPGLAFLMQLDTTFRGGVDVINPVGIDHVLYATNGDWNSGILVFEGTPNAGTNWGTVECPNATITDINNGLARTLTTREYVTNAVATAASVIPRYVDKVLFKSTGAQVGWTSVDATTITGGDIPRDAVAVIIEHYYNLWGPDTGDETHIRVRAPSQSGNALQWYVVEVGYAGGGDDNVSGGGQGTFPIENGYFEYTVEAPGFGACEMAVIGYFGAS